MHNFLQDILKESNTIIIPGLGALTITSTKTGDIYFMPFLKHDDGHLAKYVAEHENVELSEAKQILTNFVEAIKTAIAEGDVFEMEKFGRFLKNNEGEIDFQRWEDYQVVDNSILSKKIKEREKTTPKPIVKKEIIQNTPIIEIDPIDTTVEEAIITPIHEEIITPIYEEKETEEFTAPIIVSEQKSIDEILKNIEEEKIEVVQEKIISESIVEPTIVQELEIEAPYEQEIEEPIIMPTESKKDLLERLKSEKALQLAEAKKQAHAAKLEQQELDKSKPKEKKKSKSILIWLFLAIVLTGGIMWYINDQRSKEVHLVAEKDGKTVVSKVVEKDELRSEIATLREKHEPKKKEELKKKEEIKVASEEKTTPSPVKKEEKVVTKAATKPVTKPVAKPATKPITTTTPSKTTTTEVKTAPKSTTNKSTSTNVASSTKETTPAVAKSKTTATAVTKPVTPATTTAQKTTTPSGPTPYVSKNRNIHAMVGSFKDKESADKLVTNLKAEGFPESYTVLENGIYNVSLGSFSTLSESYNAVKKYKSGKPAVK